MAVDAPIDHLVVGAGMSGLAYAVAARRRGARVRLLERTSRVGGVVETLHTQGYRHERAATSVPSTARGLRALLAAVGGDDLLVPAAPAADAQFLLTSSGLVRVPRSLPALLRSPLLRPGARLRALGELAVGPRRPRGGETLAAFVRRRFGRGVERTFLAPFTHGIYGADPAGLGAADAFPRLVALERRRGGILRGLLAGGLGGSASAATRGTPRAVLMPRGGMDTLPRTLADALGDDVGLGVEITRIEPGDTHTPARVTAADGRTWATRELVLALPAPAQAALLAPSHPHLAATLRAVDAVPMVVAAVGYAAGRGPALPAGFGFLRGEDSTARILGATFPSRLDPTVAPEGASLLTVYVGGSEDRAAVDLPEATLRTTILADLEAALGGPLEPDLFHLTRWRRAIPRFVPGHRARLAAAGAELAGARVRLLGSHVTGVSLEDCCRPAAPLAGPLPAGLVRC